MAVEVRIVRSQVSDQTDQTDQTGQIDQIDQIDPIEKRIEKIRGPWLMECGVGSRKFQIPNIK